MLLNPATGLNWIEHLSYKIFLKEKQSFVVRWLTQNKRTASPLYFYFAFSQGLIWLTMDESTWGQWPSSKHQWLLANDQKQEQGGLKGSMALRNTLISHFWPQGLWDSEVLLWLFRCLSLWWCVWKFRDDNVLCQECSISTCILFTSQGVLGVKHGEGYLHLQPRVCCFM